MKKEISALVEEGTLTPVADLTTIKDDDPHNGPFREGFVMQHVPDALTRGYTSHVQGQLWESNQTSGPSQPIKIHRLPQDILIPQNRQDSGYSTQIHQRF